VLNPLTPEETASLTLAMAASGERLDLSQLPAPTVDKHSTGGVGDKVTLVLMPLLAACGLTIVKMSGRGLGMTGGTVDKLESVPGFRMDLSPGELLLQAKKIGCAITGSTANLAPADKALYALRDATQTVASIPLIVSSILSKKLAGGAKTVVLDVKCGSGAFMANFDEAESLARSLKETANLCGLDLHLSITDMNQPLGRAVGNALEVREALEVLHGDLVGRLPELCLHLAGKALFAAKHAPSRDEGSEMAREAIKRGRAIAKAEEWFAAQGADPQIARSIEGLPKAPYAMDIVFGGSGGWVMRLDARSVGEAAVVLGAGRRTKGDAIEPGTGIEVFPSIGSRLEPGQPAFRVHARSQDEAEAVRPCLEDAITVSAIQVPKSPLILGEM
jgi:pyrimidine-nucleoside phosphorylase